MNVNQGLIYPNQQLRMEQKLPHKQFVFTRIIYYNYSSSKMKKIWRVKEKKIQDRR